MEEKKVIKISLSTFFLILAIIAIVIMAIFMYKLYNENIEANQKTAELQIQASNLNRTISNLQEKINTISSTINSTESNTTNIDDKGNDNRDSSTKLSNEDIIKDLYLSELKKLDNNNSEKLLDYRVDKVEIIDNTQSFVELGYNSNDTLAYITYSIKPQNVNSSVWIAGNGEIEGEWIINKLACVCLRNGKLIDVGTSW